MCVFQMSAGLMSCVRENSPPLESPSATPGTGASGNNNSGHITGSHIGTSATSNILDPNDIPITITTPEHHHQGRFMFRFNLMQTSYTDQLYFLGILHWMGNRARSECVIHTPRRNEINLNIKEVKSSKIDLLMVVNILVGVLAWSSKKEGVGPEL